MNTCYSESASFSDPVFTDLSTREVQGMWEMLCASARDFSLKYEIVEADESHAHVHWVAIYSFGPAQRRVENRVSTRMDIVDGKIVRQVDDFSFPRWARQAFGPFGLVLGVFPFFKSKVQATAKSKLTNHLDRKR